MNPLKVGGPGFEGRFPNKKGHLKTFPGNVGDGEGGGSSQKHFPDIPNKFSGYITFFPKYEHFFPLIPKNFQDI